MACLCFWSDKIFPEKNGVLLIPLLALFGLANINFSMVLSTIFSDSKLAN